jgi:hypothetical protein
VTSHLAHAAKYFVGKILLLLPLYDMGGQLFLYEPAALLAKEFVFFASA